jgi:DNA-binding transcriptional ArsR family regulator
MVIRYELVGSDLGSVRFAISPLNEVVLSLRGWHDPGRYPLNLPWLREVAAGRDRLDSDLLSALVNEDLWTPDFLTPSPRSPLTRIEEEIAAVAAVPPEVVDHGLRMLHDGGLPRPLRGPRVLGRIVDALEAYWEMCFVPYWPRMRALLEGDVTFRGREIAQRGLAAMLAGLAGRVRLNGDVVEVHPHTNVHYARPATGGLTLVPSMWTKSASAPISPDEPPMIIYLARGGATMWEPQSLPAPGALAAILGEHRAGLLVQLGTPVSSTELATRLGVTTAAVNQHLRVLRAAGLLVSARHGRSVLYRRSDLGDHLIAGQSASPPYQP